MHTPLSHLNWRLILTAVLATTASALPTFLTAATIAQAGEELGYGPLELGYLTAGFFLVAALSSSQIGGLAERLGWRKTLQISTAASAVIMAAISLTVDSLLALGVYLVIAASFYGVVNPASNLALAREIPDDRRGLVFGIKHAGIPTSTMLSGLAVPLVVVEFGWRAAFQAGVVIAVFTWLLIPQEKQDTSSSEAVRSAAPDMMPLRYLSALALGSACATIGAVALGAFTVDAAISQGIEPGAAGSLLAGASVASIVMRATYGHLADRQHATGLGSASILMLIGGVLFMALTSATQPWFAALVVALFATAWAWPGLMTYGIVRANQGRPAGSTAITQAGIFVGAGLGPVGIGWLIENQSYAAGWTATSVSLLIAASVVMWVRKVAL